MVLGWVSDLERAAPQKCYLWGDGEGLLAWDWNWVGYLRGQCASYEVVEGESLIT